MGLPRSVAAITWFIAGAGTLVFGSLAVVAGIAAAGGFFTALIVGPWDFLVWLTKSDWPTTHFQAPVVGVVVGVAALIVAHVSGTIWEYCLRAWDWGSCASNGATQA